MQDNSTTAAKSLDHFVILVRDLNQAKRAYERLGFHVRPVATHESVGSSNCIIHTQASYVELICLDGAREDVAGPYMDRLQLGDGLTHVSLQSSRVEDEQAHLRQAGFSPSDVINARRQLTLPDGSTDATASRSLYNWREDNRYLSLFYSDHAKPHTIFIPAYACHANGAREVTHCVFMSTTLEADRDYFSASFRSEPVVDKPGYLAWRGPRGDLSEVLSPENARERYGSLFPEHFPAPLAGVPIALHYSVASTEECERTLSEAGAPFQKIEGSVAVAASEAMGVVTVFQEAEPTTPKVLNQFQ